MPPPRAKSSSAPVGLLGEFTQRHSARSASLSSIALRSSRQASSTGTGTARQPREHRAHLVGGIRHSRVEHRVAVGSPQVQPLRQRADELLRADARRERGRLVDVEAPSDPAARGGAQRGAADRRRDSRARRSTWRARAPPSRAAGRTACRPTGRPSRRRGAPRPRRPRRDGRTGTAGGTKGSGAVTTSPRTRRGARARPGRASPAPERRRRRATRTRPRPLGAARPARRRVRRG